jgi:hypothetical protein
MRRSTEERPPAVTRTWTGTCQAWSRGVGVDPGKGSGRYVKRLLGQDELVAVEPGAHQRIARLEDPAVHHLGNRLARRASERRPQIAGIGVGVRVTAEVLADAVAEDAAPRYCSSMRSTDAPFS